MHPSVTQTSGFLCERNDSPSNDQTLAKQELFGLCMMVISNGESVWMPMKWSEKEEVK